MNSLFSRIKLWGWYALHQRDMAAEVLMKKLHILTLRRSRWYRDCEEYYSDINVKGKNVLDLGCDFGTSPAFFLERGARNVYGFSMDLPYFRKHDYFHFTGELAPGDMEIIEAIGRICRVLKADIEGFEWNFTPEFIEKFDDWIIAVHTPVENKELLKWLAENGTYTPGPNGCEFALYQKRKVADE